MHRADVGLVAPACHHLIRCTVHHLTTHYNDANGTLGGGGGVWDPKAQSQPGGWGREGGGSGDLSPRPYLPCCSHMSEILDL